MSIVSLLSIRRPIDILRRPIEVQPAVMGALLFPHFFTTLVAERLIFRPALTIVAAASISSHTRPLVGQGLKSYGASKRRREFQFCENAPRLGRHVSQRLASDRRERVVRAFS